MTIADHYSILPNTTLETIPYRHFVSDLALNKERYDYILGWLLRSDWRREEGAFYDLHHCETLNSIQPGSYPHPFEEVFLKGIRDRLQIIFRTILEDHVKVAAIKLDSGQFIGVHNDSPRDKSEDHRLTIQLMDPSQSPVGGSLLILKEKDSNTVHRRVYAASNIGFGFMMSKTSYHAVERVTTGTRYSVVFSFKSKNR